MFQDAAGTTPVTAAGQSVGLLLDKSGNANHASQANNVYRPVLRQDSNGHYYLEKTGGSTALNTSAFAFGSDKALIVMGSMYTGTGTGTALSFGALGSQTNVFDFGFNGQGLLLYRRGSGSFGARGSQKIGTVPAVCSAYTDLAGTTHATEIPHLRVDGQSVLGANTFTYGATDSGSGDFGNYALNLLSGFAAFTGRLYQVVVRSGVSTVQEIESTEDFVAEKTLAYNGTYQYSYTPTTFNDTGANTSTTGYIETSSHAHADYTTTATEVEVVGYGLLTTAFATWNEIGVYVDGTFNQVVNIPCGGSFARRISLPAGSKTVSFVNGLQAKPVSDLLGTFLVSINSNAPMTEVSSATTNRIVVYGDSIASGSSATIVVSESWVELVRATYSPDSLACEAWGTRALRHDAIDATARTAFVAKIAAYSPSIIWLAIGTNDYGLNLWTAANFETAYAALLDDLHTELPSAVIYAQTPLLRTTETANGLGSTMGDYRTAISNAVSTRTAYTTLVDGTAIMTTASLVDGVHPTTAGHVLYSDYVQTVLGI
jgi:lysophospholipase L1-like esterase